MGQNAYNLMIPLSGNDRTEELLVQCGRFMVNNVPELLVQTAFWGKLCIPIMFEGRRLSINQCRCQPCCIFTHNALHEVVKSLNCDIPAHSYQISQRQQKSRPWLALISATMVLFSLSTLYLCCAIYSTFIQTQLIMLSSDFNFNNRVVGSRHLFWSVGFVEAFATSVSVSVCICSN
jgi:hypothetical protein